MVGTHGALDIIEYVDDSKVVASHNALSPRVLGAMALLAERLEVSLICRPPSATSRM